jgi:hypothetical protein
MNSIRFYKCCLVLFAALCAGDVLAARGHGGRVHFGVVVGAPFYSPWYHSYPYYYYPSPYYYPSYAPVVIERSPPVYIEQSTPLPAQAPQPAPANYWYYCAASKGYYPYVNECPSGWQKVLPQPPNPD